MQNANISVLDNAKLLAEKRAEELRFARMLARIKPEIEALERQRSHRTFIRDSRRRKIRTIVVTGGVYFIVSTFGFLVAISIYSSSMDGFYSKSYAALGVIQNGAREKTTGATVVVTTETTIPSSLPISNTKNKQIQTPAIKIGSSSVKTHDEDIPVENSVDVTLKPRRNKMSEPVITTSAKTDSKTFEVTAYMDGFLMVRQGPKVTAIKLGETLPDGKILRSIAGGTYKAD